MDKKGRVFYRVNDSAAMLFFSGVRTTEPLWALIDVYGLTRGVQLLGRYISEKIWHCYKLLQYVLVFLIKILLILALSELVMTLQWLNNRIKHFY